MNALRNAVAGAGFLGVCATLGEASAADTTLRVADSLPPHHYIIQHVTLKWMEDVKARTGGKVDFAHFPAGQLGKGQDYLALAATGVADVAYLMPSIMSEKLPLSIVADLPLEYDDPCDATAVFYDLATGDGILAENDYAPQGVRVLIGLVLPQNELFLARDGVADLSGIAGLKVRATAGARERSIQALGANPVNMASSEMAESVRRGTIDGTMMLASSILDYHVEDAIKSWSTKLNLGGLGVAYVISDKKWNTLPEGVRTAMADAGHDSSMAGCRIIDDIEKEARKKMAGIVGEPFQLPDAQAENIRSLLKGIAADWASALDTQGKAGTDALNAFEGALSAKNTAN